MDQITEDLNKEMLTDIYNLKKKLKMTQMENNDLQIELSKQRLQLITSNKKVEELEKKIDELEKKSDEFEKKSIELEEKNLALSKKNDELIEEKSTLKEQYYQQLQLKSQEGIWSNKNILEEFKPDYKITNGYVNPFQYNNNNSSYFSQPDVNINNKKDSTLITSLTNGANGHSNGNDDTINTTLAEKLKQSQGNFFDTSSQTTPHRPMFKPTINNSPVVINGTSTASPVKIVVKEPNQILKNHNTRSLYVAGLYKGLTQPEVKKYFEKFGKIINVTVPPVVDNIVDGQKYLFIKFETCDSVDKVLKQDYHTIKDISVRTKPGKNV